MPVFAHHAHAQRVKGAHQHVFGLPPDERLGPLAHLSGGFVGKGDGRNPLGLHAFVDHVGDFVRDDPRLARASASQDEARTIGVMDSLELSEVESGGHGADVWRRALPVCAQHGKRQEAGNSGS